MDRTYYYVTPHGKDKGTTVPSLSAFWSKTKARKDGMTLRDYSEALLANPLAQDSLGISVRVATADEEKELGGVVHVYDAIDKAKLLEDDLTTAKAGIKEAALDYIRNEVTTKEHLDALSEVGQRVNIVVIQRWVTDGPVEDYSDKVLELVWTAASSGSKEPSERLSGQRALDKAHAAIKERQENKDKPKANKAA